MTARGKLFIQYNNKRDGTPKEEDEIKAKQMESFTVRDENPFFFLDYEFENGCEYRFVFLPDGISVICSFLGEPDSQYALTDFGGFLRLDDDSDKKDI